MRKIQSPYLLGEKAKHIAKLLNLPDCEAINIQLKRGEEIPIHHANRDVFIIVRSGVVSFVVEGRPVELTSESVLHMEPFEKHSLEAKEDVDLVVLKVGPRR